MSRRDFSVPVLDESLSSVKRFFDESVGNRRFVTVLSPTCPACVDGANAVRDTVLDQGGDDVDVLLVWIPMLDGDTEEAIERSVAKFDDFDVAQFVDSEQHLGRQIARSLGGRDSVAWDIYLFYGSGVQWKDEAPSPDEWIHQLGTCSWAPADRYRCGNDLRAALAETIQEV